MGVIHPLDSMQSRQIRVAAHLLERGDGHARVHSAFWEADPGLHDDAPVQVCVHGLGGSHLNWSLLAQRLTGFGPVWAPDMAGFGYTEPSGRSASVEDNADLLAGFIETISPGRPVLLLGNSMGGHLAYTVAARRPELVAGLVLVGPAVPPVLGETDPYVALRFLAFTLPGVGRAYLEQRVRRMSPARQVRETMALCAAHPEGLDRRVLAAHVELATRRRRMRHAHPSFLTASRSLMMRLGPGRPRLWKEIDAVRAPVLLVQGGKDRVTLKASCDVLAERRPDWEHRIYPELGHVVMLEDPDRLADDLTDWRAEVLDDEPDGQLRAAQG